MKRFRIAMAVTLVAAAVAIPTQAAFLQASGELTLLRVHDRGGYGPPADRLDVEVIIKLDSKPDMAFGFQLRDDRLGPAHQGMFDLLRDAFSNGWTVTIDFDLAPKKKAGVIRRVWLTK